MTGLDGALPGWDTVFWVCFYGIIGIVGCLVFLSRLIRQHPEKADQKEGNNNLMEERQGCGL